MKLNLMAIFKYDKKAVSWKDYNIMFFNSSTTEENYINLW